MQKVYFQRGFHERNHPEEQRKPGVEVKVGKEFSWEGKLWKIPAVYLFEEGVVMDLCCRIDPDSLRRYYREREQFSGRGWTDSEIFAFWKQRIPGRTALAYG